MLLANQYSMDLVRAHPESLHYSDIEELDGVQSVYMVVTSGIDRPRNHQLREPFPMEKGVRKADRPYRSLIALNPHNGGSHWYPKTSCRATGLSIPQPNDGDSGGLQSRIKTALAWGSFDELRCRLHPIELAWAKPIYGLHPKRPEGSSH
ncbi:hypothetical protein GJ744_012003 [Endocarpon pusillum]|uniref:Uncharacterized protein n=1 Tax=Endocarpon pusillum TaxID=364733 RepID=A0A8H7AXF9_9EURO|nr:hypothetical protein GJ744_012003 [Endocarpon pusillum]